MALLKGVSRLYTDKLVIHGPIGCGMDVHRRYGLWIIGGQTTNNPPGGMSKCPQRNFKFYNLSHLIEGEGLASFNNGSVQHVHEGDCVVVTPDTSNAFGSTDDKNYLEDTLLFVGSVADSLCAAGVLTTGVFHIGTQRRLLKIAEMSRDPSGPAQINANIALQQLLMDIYHSNIRDILKADAISKVISEIRDAPARWWTVDELVEISGRSYSSLRRDFVARTGLCPKSYIEQFKMHNAMEMLHHGISIADTAKALGYQDEYHFARRFKMHFGISPGRCRSIIKCD